MDNHATLAGPGAIHDPYDFSYADATARGAATGFVAGDVGKLARQLDNNTLWMLTDESPITWLQMTGSGVGGAVTSVNGQTGAVTLDLDDIGDVNAPTPGDGDVLSWDATPGEWVPTALAGAYTDEMAQDAIGAMIADTPSINLTYTDATPELKADAIFGTSAGTVAEGNHTHTVTVALNFVIDGGGSAITTGLKGFVRVPFAWSDIAKASLLADASCSAVVDIWKDTFANHPPTDADSMTAAAPLTLSTADSVEDSTLTGWTQTGSAGDVLAFNVDSNDTAELLTVVLDLVRSL
jgi:hypothetical protein